MKYVLRPENDHRFEQMGALCEATRAHMDGVVVDSARWVTFAPFNASCASLFAQLLLQPLNAFELRVLQAEHYLAVCRRCAV